MLPLSPLNGFISPSLLRMLLLSLALHLAVLMIVQPTRVKEMAASPPITARLMDAAPAMPPEPEPDEVAVPAAKSVLAPVAREREPEPARDVPAVPRPAPELPVPLPVPVQPAPAAPEPAAMVRPVDAARGREAGPSAPPAEAKTALPSVPVTLDTTWYEVRQLDVQPRVLGSVQPAYPGVARRRGVEGSVKLMLKIDEFGVVQAAAVEEGDPPGVFDAAALEAFRQARFSPAKKNQRPVRALVYVRVVFRLE
jgi:protein TonB